ncbi:unnamed protein product [Ceratitis capitata]|uniref:(Mediterranean fruit fly) hypothetical protein n=1 Tax=Ceratitis capitata TaxID=7213 RepID=A0A811UWU5_CERCA|nr:unnamed protein product [Ceratitis capitata]
MNGLCQGYFAYKILVLQTNSYGDIAKQCLCINGAASSDCHVLYDRGEALAAAAMHGSARTNMTLLNPECKRFLLNAVVVLPLPNGTAPGMGFNYAVVMSRSVETWGKPLF